MANNKKDIETEMEKVKVKVNKEKEKIIPEKEKLQVDASVSKPTTSPKAEHTEKVKALNLLTCGQAPSSKRCPWHKHGGLVLQVTRLDGLHTH